MPRRAIIAGAGIAGLTAAIALARAGFTVAIYEKANSLEEFGAGLQLTPNASRILARFGLLEGLLPHVSRPSAVVVLRGLDNSELLRMPLDGAERRWGAPYLVIHRADLQGALIEAVRCQSAIQLTLGATVLGFADSGERLSIEFARGLTRTSDEADLLIGADGLHSQVRDQMGFGVRDQAKFAGRIAYRAFVNADDANVHWAQDIVLRLGKNAHLVQYPVRGGSLINLVATIGSATPMIRGANHPGHQEKGNAIGLKVENAFSGWSREARLLTTARAQWRAWPLYYRSPISSFSLGRVALVGDAAHPMVPFLAQGAAQGIEDAEALGRILHRVQDIPAALSTYSRDRVARAGRVQREALKLGRIYHLSGPLAFARDATMRLLGTNRVIKRYDWLYGV